MDNRAERIQDIRESVSAKRAYITHKKEAGQPLNHIS